MAGFTEFKLLLIILFFIGTASHSLAQSTPREILDSLCSPKFSGRAYVNNGELEAAAFIQRQFADAGLKPVGDDYFQEFTLAANVFPGKMEVSLNRRPIKPGTDFLIDADAPSLSGSFEVIPLSKENAEDPSSLPKILTSSGEVFFLMDETEFDLSSEPDRKLLDEILQLLKCFEHPTFKFKGIILISDQKLTWSPSPFQCLRPLIRVKKDVAPPIIKRISLGIEAKFVPELISRNVIGAITGSNQPDSIIAITAHYDHLGMMGDQTYFPGANDNASGVAMLIELSRFFAMPENRPEKSLVFIAFGSEEIGLKGSQYFTENPLFPLQNINFLVNLDILGTGDDGIQVVNGSIYKQQFEKLVSLNKIGDYLKEVRIRGEMCKSDHCFFHLNGVPCFYIYTLGGIAHYHDVFDHPDTLPLSEFTDLESLLQDLIRYLNSGE